MENITVNISFRKDFLESIDEAARRESRSRSEFIREAARNYICGKVSRAYDGRDREICESKGKGILDGRGGEVHENDGSYGNEIRIDGVSGGAAERAARYDTTNHSYSYADYQTWPENERWEIIDGVPYDMSPAPSCRHQEISMALSSEFYNYLKGKPCKVFAAPFDVRLPKDGEVEDKDIKTVVQPDIVVVCNRERLDQKGCVKAPDLVVEILSRYTSSKDSVKKFNLYEREGVKEYWVLRPDEQTVAVFKPGADKRYGRPEMYTAEDKIKVEIFDSLVIDLKDIF